MKRFRDHVLLIFIHDTFPCQSLLKVSLLKASLCLMCENVIFLHFVIIYMSYTHWSKKSVRVKEGTFPFLLGITRQLCCMQLETMKNKWNVCSLYQKDESAPSMSCNINQNRAVRQVNIRGCVRAQLCCSSWLLLCWNIMSIPTAGTTCIMRGTFVEGGIMSSV